MAFPVYGLLHQAIPPVISFLLRASGTGLAITCELQYHQHLPCHDLCISHSLEGNAWLFLLWDTLGLQCSILGLAHHVHHYLPYPYQYAQHQHTTHIYYHYHYKDTVLDAWGNLPSGDPSPHAGNKVLGCHEVLVVGSEASFEVLG